MPKKYTVNVGKTLTKVKSHAEITLYKSNISQFKCRIKEMRNENKVSDIFGML